MKLIFSRKGFDAENGGKPSPILPDGSLISVPIPSRRDERRYLDLLDEHSRKLTETLKDLDLFERGSVARCHLDPDLNHWSVPRPPGWRPAFGQVDAAAGHLDNQDVSPGDLFLFFGWFRRAELRKGRLHFVAGPRADLHVIFGWLQIGEIIKPHHDHEPAAWLRAHPHWSSHHLANESNRIYVARETLSFDKAKPGAGTFRYSPKLVLTKPGMTRTRWALDHSVFGGKTISYHSPASWKADYFQSASKGQEFVVDCDRRIEAWLEKLFDTSLRAQ